MLPDRVRRLRAGRTSGRPRRGVEAVLTVHIAVGISVIASSLIAGAWGGVAWLRRRPSVGFWYALRVEQVAVVLQATLGAILLLSGCEAASGLHYVYGISPVLISVLAEGARAGAAERELVGLDFESLPSDRQHSTALAIVRRETGIMAVSALVVFGLAVRAATTG